MGLGLVASPMLHQQLREANCFVTEFFANEVVAGRGFVAFVK